MWKEPLNLQHLVNRIKIDEKLMEKHPEERRHLERRIKTSKDLILKTVLSNDGNKLLEKISLEGENYGHL